MYNKGMKRSTNSILSAVLWTILFFMLSVVSFVMFVGVIDNNPFGVGYLVLFIFCQIYAIRLIIGAGIRAARQKQVYVESEPVYEPEEEEIELPETPKPKAKSERPSVPAYNRAYRPYVDALEEDQEEMRKRVASVKTFLDDYFGRSEISKARYLNILNQAADALENRWHKASTAAILYGNSQPTQKRLDLLKDYQEEGQKILDQTDQVIDALLIAQQNDTFAAGDRLEASLKELADTTACYQSESAKVM